MSEKLIVIGDIHGCSEELKILLHQLPLDHNSTLLFLGDYVDRGPDSKGVIDTVLNVSELYKVIALRGNHEWMFEEYLRNPRDAVASSNFILNGGSSTLASYSEDGVKFTVPKTHLVFLDKLLHFHTTEKYFFVHAGIPPDFDFNPEPDSKTLHQMLWIRSVFLDSKVKWPKIVVHGHTPMSKPEVLPNRINLDTGCVFGRSLTAYDLTNEKFYSVARNQAADPKYLVHSFGGRTRAQRFEGEVSVEVREGSAIHSFKTVNFNEFGMLISPAGEGTKPVFKVGQEISGLIKTGGDTAFEFRGTVMRSDNLAGVQTYGLKFESLQNLKEQG